MPIHQGRVTAPEFPEGMQWLNTDHPLRLSDLKGKVVLLDFWTYCCINCMHVIPDLKRLEADYPNELVVIGVHSAKFTTERDTDNIRQAILRYEIVHPVVNDSQMTIWRRYAISAWPTFVLIDPDGGIVGYTSGEGVYEPFNKLIADVIRQADAEGKLDRRPLRLRPERQREPHLTLAFPGKVLADEASGRLFVSDSNHNRILVLSLADGSLEAKIGSGKAGMEDGSFDVARFDHPQGLALDGKKLYIADTENHAIRCADLKSRTVTTLAGTGQQAAHFTAPGPARKTALNSPWDLCLHNGQLYVAMAGSHQIWHLDLAADRIGPFAGSGKEARFDGPRRSAALAQPSGITTDGARLYFADSEVSSIRSVELSPDGRVETIVGGDLFDFGDRDGPGLLARLQHPLGVAYHSGVLYVADTYNNKIKRVRLRDGTIETFLGTGEAGQQDGPAPRFDEPAGLTVANGKLYIADTNNHAIRVADLETREVETLPVKDTPKQKAR